jgi:hypothetical protein
VLLLQQFVKRRPVGVESPDDRVGGAGLARAKRLNGLWRQREAFVAVGHPNSAVVVDQREAAGLELFPVRLSEHRDDNRGVFAVLVEATRPGSITS